ncbi:hypothetical protein M407DRAFT_14918 [Tulasnella calospora MUT 4182]|uniref:diacylglycerol O-acyltransferase n=1 Tax=Tulasnella calospora MUT 4182 TaxID=1051891 RepID=A0A0C3M0W8_9AGAM|nr:hypothetical protein M407DRAFT_14918 [Tulasnella calospora MUT 4182]
MPICLVIFFLLCSLPPLWPLIVLYISWVFLIDNAPDRGGRPSKWMRSLRPWSWFAGYYPASGAFATFATESTGFSKAFPGIKPHLLTLASNFHIPLYRDLLLSLGICSVSKKSCINILSSGPGSAITIVIGGAAESLAARPGTAASLVPVFSFGENDIYDQLSNEKGTTIYKMQKTFQRIFGFTLPLFHGRGLLTYNVGLLPFRHPIVSVVGRPIAVIQSDKPTKEYVEQVQAQYIEELVRIWDTYKDTYARERTSELKLID